jgi:hypothetical protein
MKSTLSDLLTEDCLITLTTGEFIKGAKQVASTLQHVGDVAYTRGINRGIVMGLIISVSVIGGLKIIKEIKNLKKEA